MRYINCTQYIDAFTLGFFHPGLTQEYYFSGAKACPVIGVVEPARHRCDTALKKLMEHVVKAL